MSHLSPVHDTFGPPPFCVQRVCVFKWVGAVAVDLGTDSLGSHLTPLLRPVYREYVDARQTAGRHSLHAWCNLLCVVYHVCCCDITTTTNIVGGELHSLAEEVMEVLKGLAGREAFARAFAAVQKEVADIRESRKRRKALDVSISKLI